MPGSCFLTCTSITSQLGHHPDMSRPLPGLNSPTHTGISLHVPPLWSAHKHMQLVCHPPSQVHTRHLIPNYRRPWEGGSDGQSESSGFVVCTTRRLIMTTAGAVEFSRKVRSVMLLPCDGCVATHRPTPLPLASPNLASSSWEYSICKLRVRVHLAALARPEPRLLLHST